MADFGVAKLVPVQESKHLRCRGLSTFTYAIRCGGLMREAMLEGDGLLGVPMMVVAGRYIV